MARIFTTLRTHWKKSIFFSLAGSYGIHRARIKYEDNCLMKDLCAEAKRYGELSAPLSQPLYNVTVILNPAASKGGARRKYEDYCAPILNLAGIRVSVIRTEAEGQAKDIMDIMKDADAVLIAGGDGTVMEAVTGFLRRSDAEELRKTLPLGILPVGTENKLAKSLFPDVSTSRSLVPLMAQSAMACVKQLYRPVDVMQVESLSEDPKFQGKKIYGMSQFQLGAFRDAHERLSKYWYYANLKKVMGYVFAYTSSAKEIMWSCSGKLEVATPHLLSHPLETFETEVPLTWWEYFFGKKSSSNDKPEVETSHYLYQWTNIDSVPHFKGLEICVTTPNTKSFIDEIENHTLELILGPDEMDFSDFVKIGYSRENSECEVNKKFRIIKAPSIRYYPSDQLVKNDENEEKKTNQFSLDNESVDLIGPIELTLLPEKIVMFCSDAIKVRQNSNQVEEPSSNLRWWQKRKTNINQNLQTMNYNRL